jgi:hypothetical protein
VTLIGLLAACSDTSKEQQQALPQISTSEQSNVYVSDETDALKTNKQALLTAIQEMFSASVSASLNLDGHTEKFILAPDESNYQALVSAWQTAHQKYRISQTSQAFSNERPSFDDELNSITPLHTLDSRLDSFPLLPGYLDQVDGYPTSGLIYSEVELSIDVLSSEHQFSDPAYVTLGFHAFDTILQGDKGIAIKPWQRFNKTGIETQDKAALRRQRYLQLLAKQIKTDIALEANDWLQPQGLYSLQLNQASTKDLKQWAREAASPKALDAYIENETEHSGEPTAKAIRSTFERLAQLANLEEAPEQTEPSDSLSQE